MHSCMLLGVIYIQLVCHIHSELRACWKHPTVGS